MTLKPTSPRTYCMRSVLWQTTQNELHDVWIKHASAVAILTSAEQAHEWYLENHISLAD